MNGQGKGPGDPPAAFEPTDLDWLPGSSTLPVLKSAARAAGFEFWLTASGVWWAFELQSPYLGRLAPDPHAQLVWDATIVDHGVAELSYLADDFAFRSFARIATKAQTHPGGRAFSWVPNNCSGAALLRLAWRMGYTHVWHPAGQWYEMQYPREHPVAQEIVLGLLGFPATDRRWFWTGRLVRPGCVVCVATPSRRAPSNEPGLEIYVASAEHVQARIPPEG